jgi:DNA-directed RNA polymerase specialized sigma subunit
MFEWLKNYQQLEEEIAFLEYNLENTEAELDRWIHGDLQYVRLTEGSQGGKVEESIEQIKKELAFKNGQRDKLLNLVGKFKGLEHQILKLKYVDGMNLEEIAEELSYSTSHIKKRHAELARLINFMDSEQVATH